MFDAALIARAKALIAAYTERGEKIVTAESCTGGLIAALLTEIPGSSAVVERGYVTYSNEAKAEALGIEPVLIAQRGAVSREVALAMAEGALTLSRADVSVSVTGIAGPGGGNAAKPVGLVHFALARRGVETRHVERRFGDLGRSAVRNGALEAALAMLETAART